MTGARRVRARRRRRRAGRGQRLARARARSDWRRASSAPRWCSRTGASSRRATTWQPERRRRDRGSTCGCIRWARSCCCGFLGLPARAGGRGGARATATSWREAPRSGRRRPAAGRRPGRRLHDRVLLPRHASRPARRPSRRCARCGPSLDAVAPNPYRGVPAHVGREQPVRRARSPAATASPAASCRRGCIETVVARANLPAASLSYVFLRPARRGGLDVAGWAVSASGCGRRCPTLDPGQVAWVDGFGEGRRAVR